MQRHTQRLNQHAKHRSCRHPSGSISQLIWENNNKSRNPLAVQRSTKTEALKKLEEKDLKNLKIHFKPWGCPPNCHSISPCTGSNEWALLLWPEVDNNNLELLFASLALWKNLYPEKCNCIDLHLLVNVWNASILDIYMSKYRRKWKLCQKSVQSSRLKWNNLPFSRLA